ncbi:MAG: hypothetical protein ACKOGA_24250 [Planctomycetaceae bacterium]
MSGADGASGARGRPLGGPGFVQWSWSAGRRPGWSGVLLSLLGLLVIVSLAMALVAVAVVVLTVGIGGVLVRRLWSGSRGVPTWPAPPRENSVSPGETILDAEWQEVSTAEVLRRLPGPAGGKRD